MKDGNSSLKVSTFWLNAFWRALWGLNVLLFISMMMLSIVVGAVYFVDKIPLPDFVSVIIKDIAKENGLDISFNSAFVKLSGDLEINGVSARFTGSAEPFFNATKVSAGFWVAPLLTGDLKLKKLRIFDGAVGSSIDGAIKSAVISKIYLSVHKTGIWWNVDALNLRYANLALEADGIYNQSFNLQNFLAQIGADESLFDRVQKDDSDQKSKIDKNTTQPSIKNKYDEVLLEIAKYKKYCSFFTDPNLILQFRLCAEDSFADLIFQAGSATFELEKKLAKVENLSVKTKLYDENFHLSVFAESLSSQDSSLPVCKKLEASTDVSINGNSFVLENLDFSIGKLDYEGLEIRNINLRKDFLDENEYLNDWNFFAALDIYRVGGTLSITDNFGVNAEFEGNINPEIFMKRKELANIKVLKKFAFPLGISVKGALSYVSKEDIKAFLWVESNNCKVMDIPIQSVAGDIILNLKNGLLLADNVIVKSKEGWGINGSYEQNIHSKNYFIKIKGDIRPMAIASFMEKWWTRVMGSFEFIGENNFPNADAYVEGTWGHPEFIWAFVSANGTNAIYDGAKFDNFALNVWVNPTRISLYDIAINVQERRAHGSIEWLYGDKGITTYKNQRLNFNSTLNSQELIALGGEDAQEVLDVVVFKNAPNININALLYNPKTRKDQEDIFNLEAFAPGDTFIEMATLKNLRFKARSNKILTNVEEATCEFCNGQTSGAVVLTRLGKGMKFDGQIYAEKMNQAAFIDFLASLGRSENSENAQEKSSTPDGISKTSETSSIKQVSSATAVSQEQTPASANSSNKNKFIEGGETGDVTMSINLIGETTNFEMCSGAGYVNVDNKELIRLNLLGMISRAFSAVGLPLGSFDITYAFSPFTIGNGEVKFSRLEMGGSVMQIKGAASYNFIKDDIDATLAILPFGAVSMPIISSVVSLISPLTSTVQTTIDGKISDPKIGVNINPVNILQSDKRILQKIRDDL